METYAIGATAGATDPAASSTFNRMRTEDFFALLVTELQHQDPLEPTKTADMIGQVSQIRTIEQSAQLVKTLEQLTQQQRTAGASELLGKYVEAVTIGPDGSQTTTSGVVTGVRFGPDGVAVLELDTGEMIPASAVVRVTAFAEEAAATPAEAADKSVDTARRRGPTAPSPGLRLSGELNL